MSPAASTSSVALTADSLDRLGELLDANAVPNGGLPLEAVDGLIAAAVVSPGSPVSQAECLPLILGAQPWAVEADFHEASGLVLALWSDVSRRVAQDPDATEDDLSAVIGVPPNFDEMSDEDITASGYQMGSSWAFGFVLGADLRREAWEARLDRDEDLQADFYDIFALMPDEVFSDEELDEEDGDADDIGELELAGAVDVEADEDDGDEDEETELSHGERVEVIEALPQILFAMNQARLKELS